MKKTLLSTPSNFSNIFFKFLAVMLLTLAGTLSSNAQVSGYAYSETTGATYTDLTTGTVLSNGAVTCSGTFTALPAFATYTLPFTFYYNNIGYTSVSMSDNGFIILGAVGTAAANNTTPISGTTTNDSAIACYAMNLVGATATAEIKYDVLGSSPNRVFVIQYRDVQRRPSLSALAGLLNMQIRLSETTGLIEIIYRDFNMATASTTATTGQAGLRGTAASDFSSRKNTTSPWTPTSTNGGGASTDALQLSNTIGFTAGTKFTWTPCSSPTGITAVMDPDNSTLNISWTSPNIIPLGGFDYEVRTAGNPGAASPFASGNTSSNAVAVPGLSIGVPYYIYVKSNCRSVWLPTNTAPSSLTVTPICTVANLPYTQNFQGVTAPAIPACNTIATPSGGAMVTVNNTAVAYYGFNNKNLITTGSLAQNAWYFTQAINIPSAGDYKLSYKYGGTREQAFFQQKMKVYYGSTASVAGMTILLADHNDIKASPLTNTINFTVSTPGTYYVGFYGYANASQGYLQLDDIVLDYSTCKKPTALVSGQVTSNSAVISWTEPSPIAANGYQYYTTAVTGTVATAGAFTIGSYYRILSIGSTSFTGIGASGNTLGTVFQATGVGAGTGTAQLITTVPATSIVPGSVYQIISVGTTNFVAIGGANTAGTFFLATAAGTGTGLVQLVPTPLSSQVPTSSTLPGGVIGNLTGLTASTSYYYWVRSNCGSGDVGNWSIPNILTTSPILTYCLPSGATFPQDPNGITNVTMGSINNTTGIENNNYGDYTTLSTNVAQLASVQAFITYRTGFTYDTDIWVDWNNDGDFADTGELVYQNVSGATVPTTLNASFTVPTLDSNANSTLGPHRLRIGGIDFGPYTDPCRNGNYQAFEDYTIYVTVPPPALTLSDGTPGSISNTICSGYDTSGTPVVVSSTVASFQVYNWSPTTGVTGDPVSGYIFNPTTTTTYILTGTQTSGNFSSNSASYTVYVNQAPTAITITPSAPTTCQSDTVGTALVATGGIVAGFHTPVFTEDFNGATNTFTATNSSINNTPANAAWTLHPNNYFYNFTFNSNDSSQFYMSNSDAQGNGGTTNTELISPVFSLVGYVDASLSFWHYYRGFGAGTATVEISTDGGTLYTVLPTASWTTVTQGSSNAFVNKVLNLSAYAGMSNLRIRFKYTNATWAWYWAIDNVEVSGSNTSQVTWSPNTGLYNDSTLLSPYTGAITSTVYTRPNSTITYTASADSPDGCSTYTDVTVTVTPISGGSVTPTNQILYCSDPVGNFTLAGNNGTIVKWQSSPNGTAATFATGAVDIASTSSVLTPAMIGAVTANRYYRAVVTNAGCTAYSNIVAITITKTIWTTAWSNGTPDATKAVEFQGNYPAGTGSITACSVVVTSGAVVFDTNETLTVQGEVKVNGGSLTFNDDASLYQVLDVTNSAGAYNGNGGTPGNGNSGSITYKRTTPGIRQFDYTYWSSPIYPYTLIALSPNTPVSSFYRYVGASQTWVNASGLMAVGTGYIIRAPYPYTSTPQPYTGTFLGVPNNGDLSTAIVGGSNQLNLIGNPYPSALDADAFLTNGTNTPIIGGTLYFWTHNTDINLGQYTGNDYATYTVLGGAASANTGGALPSRYIAAGQSFFINGDSNGNAIFKNTMRVAGSNNVFFKSNNTTTSQDVLGFEKHRYWIDIANTEGAFKEMLVGYVETATTGLDRLFDGQLVDIGNAITVYTKVDDKKLTIQGRPLPFDQNDTVPLCYKSTIVGNYTITLPRFDGLFTEQNVYLEDKVLNVIHNLNESGYTFTTEIGTFEDRFVLRYTDTSLGIDNPNFDSNTVVVYHNNQGLHINSGNVNIKNVTIFDIRGRQIANKVGVGATETVFTNLPQTEQVLLVKIEGENGKTVTKKVVY